MKRLQDRKNSRIIEDIYDIIFNTQFKNEAIKRFEPLWKTKHIEVNFTEGKEKCLLIGKKYKLTLTVK